MKKEVKTTTKIRKTCKKMRKKYRKIWKSIEQLQKIDAMRKRSWI